MGKQLCCCCLEYIAAVNGVLMVFECIFNMGS